MGRTRHHIVYTTFCGKATSARTAQCSGEAWAEETELAKTRSRDRAQRFGKLKMNTRASSAGRVAGLFFHLFIHSFNKNSLSIYSARPCADSGTTNMRSSSLGSSQPLGSGERNAVEKPGRGCYSAWEDPATRFQLLNLEWGGI